jgi:hypothetical protein
MKPRIDRSVAKVPSREPDRKNDAHRKMVKRLPCLVGGKHANPPDYLNDPHHLQRGLDPKERGTGRKAADRWLVPICRKHHKEAEKDGDDEAYFAAKRIDARGIASALWTARGDEDAMRRIIERSLLSRRIYVDA